MDKKTLKEFRNLKKEIDQLKQEKENIILTCVGAVKTDGVHTSGGKLGDVTSKTAVAISSISEIIDKKIETYVEMLAEVEKTISTLPESKERMLMRFHYINGLSWEKTAEELNLSVRHVTRLHGNILLKIK